MSSQDSYLMAIDAGTGSCRAAIFDLYGNQVSFARREWRHLPVEGVPGSQTFDTGTNWKLICQCVRESLQNARLEHNPSAVRAVSAASMREGMVLFDSQGREIWACPNVDSRAVDEAAFLVKNGDANRIYSISGDWVSITDSPRFLWIKKHEPELFRRIAHVGMLSDWILYRLSGRFVTEPSIGSSSGMFDLGNRTWSKEIIEICALDRSVFPEVLPAGTALGEVTSEASSDTGLKAGTLVAVGGADTQLGLAGIGVAIPGQITVLGGTFWQHTILMEKPEIDPEVRLRTLCSIVPDQWMMEGIGFYSGLVMRWFRDAFCEEEKEEARKSGEDVYALMERKASTVPPGANGVIGIFSNLMKSGKWVHASPSFVQFDISNPESSGKKECIRAIEEAAGFVSLGHVRILEEITRTRPREIVFTGGGSKGSLWPQIISDMLGVLVRVPVVKESTALGAALCAGTACGAFDSIEKAGRDIAKFEKTYFPDEVTGRAYSILYRNWSKVYSEMLKLSENGLVAPLWRAPGT